ncbi:rho family-interacting cell polarization regulator 1 isoform X1 [Phyllopteryx taeniolatus]|uniref:rho family-interacting cell polarization regulator 1 isoform X1 n=1 Tax=Phyllopteryx taeniolatus TaxID=161469 RepID=UPI002AD4F02D|nr:rho family-interacting cell polarization regulator 1 isoform X1 [Phyllopteryx taeniolatus]XP_061622143.1 rho family-interacting cell polarization regulator 1 isoform X1 [Phyllopteryx taeniolatus]
MFTGSTKLPPAKTPQPERLDEVYAALRRGLQSYLQVHQLELDTLGQQIRENKRNGRLGSLYEQDKQVKAIERFMRRLEFHLSKVEELYDGYCIQRRLRDGASKMVAAFNSATGSKEARESLSEANRGFRECTEHMCSLESELESHMGEFHVKMKGLAGFARLCAGDQYEVLMRYGRQRWRLRGRVEVSSKQIWDSEEYIFLPLVTELLSIKVTELKSLANHVVVGSVSCEMLDLFCPLPQTLAVDINDLGTVKLNLEVTWSPFDKDDQTSSTSTVSKRLLSNQSPPDTPSMREQVFYSLLKRQGELDNGTVWSNSSESSDDSSSPALAHHAQRLSASNVLQTAVPAPHKSSASTPSLSSNQEEDESEAGEVFSPRDSVHNGHPTSCSRSRVGETGPECTVTDRLSVQPAELLGTSAERSRSCSDVSSTVAESLERTEECPAKDSPEDLTLRTTAGTTEAEGPRQPAHHLKHSDGAPTVPFPTSSSFTQEVETALESFDFLNCSDLEEEEEEEAELQEQADHQEKDERQEDDERRTEDEHQEKEEQEEEDEHQKDDKGAKQAGEEQHGEDQDKSEQDNRDKKEEDKEMFYSGASDEEAGDGLEFLMEAPEGFRNSDEDRVSESQESSAEEEQDLSRVELPEEEEGHGEDPSHDVQEVEAERPPTPSHLATTVF